jgi:ABC-type thiamin/hydroxymethylpyrimidine transport system permease subunit
MKEIENIKYIAFPVVFGVLWGLFEMIFGSYLHIVNFPLRGALMIGLGSVFMVVLRNYVNRPGVNLIASFACIVVKLFSYGGFKLGPVVGILIEGVIFEVSFFILKFNIFSVFVATFLAVFESVPHFFITTWIIYGGSIFEVYMRALGNIADFFGFSTRFYIKIFSIWIFAHFLIALFSFLISKNILKWLKNEI